VTRVHDDAPLVPQPIVSIYIIGVLSRKGGIRLWRADHFEIPPIRSHAAALPRSVMNLRLFIRSPRRRARAACLEYGSPSISR
jgi:hypothetical protein